MPQSTKVYDVCIIGSGAGGGTAAKVLTEGGLNVVMIEAGPRLNPRKDYKEHVWPYQLDHRGADIGGRARHERTANFSPPTDFGKSTASPTPPRPARRGAGSVPALKAAARTTTAASACAFPLKI